MPPEWAPHGATWLSWPHNVETWPDELQDVELTMARAVVALASGEAVFINVSDEIYERHVRGLLDDVGARGDIRFFHIPTNDAWVRDHGAIFVRGRDGSLAATNWEFNSWGEKYPPWDLDDEVPGRMASALRLPVFNGRMVLEGGSVDMNSRGVLLTTESCLLNPNRNPDLSRIEIEHRLHDVLGATRIVWLKDGIVGDDTDGHVDDVTRFVNDQMIVTAVEDDPSDANYAPLRENWELLRGLRSDDGRPYQIVELPMPRPQFAKGERMPASYANFYVANRVVLLPAYDDPADSVAADILQRCFPDRRVVSLDCRKMIWGLGAFHCLTQQVPPLKPREDEVQHQQSDGE